MILRMIRDEAGGVIVETSITITIFILLTMGITQAGLIMWSAAGIAHGVELAARCASVSDAAIDAGLDPSTTPTPCYIVKDERRLEQHNNGEDFCSEQLVGAGPPSSVFTVSSGSSGACASPYNKITGSYPLR